MRADLLQRAAGAALVATALLITPACGPKAGGDAVDVVFNLPPPRVPRVPLSTDDQQMMYPDVDHIGRDPFLTTAEEATFDGRVDPLAPVLPDAGFIPEKKKHGHGTVASSSEPSAPVIKALQAEVKGIILGKHNTFLFQGKMYEEGDTLPGGDWIVQNIKETGINFKSKDGQQQTVKFKVEAGGTITKDTGFIFAPKK